MQQLPLAFMVPESSWTPPAAPPDLTGVTEIALDTETKDDGLRASMGPGWAVGGGYICGISVAWAGGAMYLPLTHPETNNLSRDVIADWLRDLVRRDVRIITQNGPYDWGWLGTDFGIKAPQHLEDTLAAAVMLDENQRSYSLDNICARLGIPGKDETTLRQAAEAMGLNPKMDLYRLPAKFVGEYAARDAAATLAAWHQQEPMLRAQDLMDAYRLEVDIMPMIVEMRRRGIRIDLDAVDEGKRTLGSQRDAALAELSRLLTIGRDVTMHDVMSPTFLETAFTQQMGEYSFPRTKKTNKGSFETDWMAARPESLPKLVAKARRADMAASKFLDGFITRYTHRGRVHPEINALRSSDDDGSMRGTRSYRFSYSDPPLQQMPSPKRDKEVGTIVRSCFVPEEGERWAKLDYSQQEYRQIVHFAHLMHMERAADAVALYQSDPNTDFHRMVMNWTGLDRPRAKDCNFAKAYGAGVRKFAAMIGRSQTEAEEIYKKYDAELPFVSGLAKECAKWAQRRGYIRLLDGARCRFDEWEPGYGYHGHWHPPTDRDEALRRVADDTHDWYQASLKRAFTHKAMNRLIQGSSARQTKIAMRDCWREGIVPLLQLHDELDVSFSDAATVRRVEEIMRDAVKLSVPMLAEAEWGPDWGHADQAFT